MPSALCASAAWVQCKAVGRRRGHRGQAPARVAALPLPARRQALPALPALPLPRRALSARLPSPALSPLQEKQKKDAAAAANGKSVKQSAGELRLQKGAPSGSGALGGGSGHLLLATSAASACQAPAVFHRLRCTTQIRP